MQTAVCNLHKPRNVLINDYAAMRDGAVLRWWWWDDGGVVVYGKMAVNKCATMTSNNEQPVCAASNAMNNAITINV